MNPASPDLDPPRGLPVRIGGYLFFLAVSLGILITGQRLDRADLTVPFAYQGDALLILPMVKATLERGSHWRNERLGAPGIQELHDFPVGDHLHFAVIWLLGQFWPDPFVVYNLYHLLTYPLTVLTAMFVLRHFGLSVPAAGCGAILYAFLPYHYIRGLGHYFLAAYYVVPLTVLVILWVARGRLPYFREGPDGHYRFGPWSRDALTATLIAAVTSAAGAYYAFFGCAFLVMAGVYSSVRLRNWRAAVSAGLVIGFIVLGGIANHAPTMIYQARNGPNTAPHDRQPEEAEEYGMKLTHLLLPVTGHNSRFLAAVQSAYDSSYRPLQTENRTNTLGLIGSTGFLVLLAVVLLPVRKSWPLGPLAALTVFGTLLGTVGGLGALFAEFVTPQIRGYNRVAIYLAFFALMAVCWLVDRFFHARSRRARWLLWPTFLSLTAFGIWDQTNHDWFRPAIADVRDHEAVRFRADAAFFTRVEELIGGESIFMLPMVPYPETFAVGQLSGYDHARGYLHTGMTRWSFGAMKGREVDQWQREVATAPAPEMIRRLVLNGFAGLFVDRRGYSPGEADRILAEIEAVLGPNVPRVRHPDGQQVVFSLLPYRSSLRLSLRDRFKDLARAERETIRIIWLDGFDSFEPLGQESRHRWCGPRGTAVVVNLSDRTRTVRLDLLFRTMTEMAADLRIEGGDLWTERFPVNRESLPISRILSVPPGRHTIEFRCRMPSSHVPTESRHLSFFIAQFRMAEIETAPLPRAK